MKFFRLLLLPLVWAAAPAAYAQQAPYVDPALRALLRPASMEALRRAPAIGPSLRPESRALTLGVAVRKTSPVDVPRVGVFARIRNEDAIAELRAAGGRIGSRTGSIITAEVPIDNLSALLASPNFSVFEASHSVALSNDSSMRVIRANLVRRVSAGGWSGTAGRGVIVGVYDTGLDFTHEDFVDAGGHTRVLELWDQTDATGTPPPGFLYGRLCTQAAIAQVIANPNDMTPCPERDNHGHGTHVSGSAAGDGSAVGAGGTPFTYAGVAPLADMIVVKGGEGIFSESNIIDGLKWLEQEGRRLNRPMAVNVSIGTQTGAHDGSRLYEMLIDSISRPGFIVVASAGNEGFNDNDLNPDGSRPARLPTYIHGSGPAGAVRDFTIEIRPYIADQGSCNDYVGFSLWSYAPDMIDVSVLRPDGSIVTAPFGQLRDVDSPSGNVHIDNGTSGLRAANNSYQAEIRFDDCGASGAAPAAGTWTLRISAVRDGSGRPYHFWMYAQSLGSGTFAIGRQNFDNHYIVSTPANARRAIAVGAFVTKLCWTSPAKPEGPVCYSTRESLGDLARFSSGGPSRDERIKPEITAPGLGIASARSRFATPAATRILSDGVHWVNQGTSMAAPMVTGAVAIMLELNPLLTPEDVRSILSRTAEHDQFTSRVYDSAPDSRPGYWWGYGKLNVCAAVGATGSTSGSSGPVVITPAADTIPINATTRFYSCSPTGAAVAFTSSNASIASVDPDGTVHGHQVGSALIIANSGTFADTARIVVTDAARLGGSVRNLAPATSTLGKRGTRLPLLGTTLRADGFEAIRVTELSYRITGVDPAAQVELIADANRNGIIETDERVIAARTVALAGTPVQVVLPIDSLIIAQGDSVSLIVAVELSGAGPNGAEFSAEFVPSETKMIALRSHLTNRIETFAGPLASAVATTTLLTASQTYSLSENPVRSGRLVINFAQAPATAGVYNLGGRLVADLKKRIVGGSATWDLTNDDGERVASGVYLLVLDVGGTIVRQRLFVIGGAQ